ncbi:unnamed protein product [Allacma fusca]|uniref:Major facilitator superfamily (MFS) profile domain-containing protein n=1 Tax=Allacma fusca TaxID=39272 RepID=A0A8J2LMB7_9HEXA|nr:unnamed protein product [Allacma fusca]
MAGHNDRKMEAPPGFGSRHTLAIMMFFATCVSYSMRNNLSLAIVAMVNRTNPSHGINPLNISIACPDLSDDSDFRTAENYRLNQTFVKILGEKSWKSSRIPAQQVSDSGEFNWNEAEQGIILGSFFWGYVFTQIPGGFLAKKYGGKWPIGFGLLISAIFTLLTPIMAKTDKRLLIFSRIVQGVSSGLHIPAQTTLLAAWVPPNERSLFSSLAFGGVYFGTAIMLVGSGYLIHENVWGGWPSVFYVSGIVTIVWFVFWCLLVHSTPSEHPRIGRKELLYIEDSLGNRSLQPKQPTPWKHVVTSLPIWSNFIAHIAQTWGMYTLLTELPTYMKTVLNFNIRKNSWLSALPYLASWLFGVVFAHGADTLLRKNVTSIVTVRKISQVVGQLGSAIALIGCAYSGCDRALSVGLLVVSVGLNGATNSGFIVNYVDVAPNHAGVILAAWNTLASLSGVAAPFVAGVIINDDPSITNWRIVFLLSAGVYIFAVVFYLIFASGEEEPWNNFQKVSNDHPVQTEIHAEPEVGPFITPK